MSRAPANWYPDPQNSGFLRYWNGVDWTDDPVPASAADVPGQAPPSAPVAAKVPMFGTRSYAKRAAPGLSHRICTLACPDQATPGQKSHDGRRDRL